jgi:uncharacterized membrane protein YkoI
MSTFNRIVTVSMLAILSVTSPTQAQERKIQRSDLPAAVQKTVDEQSKGATIKGFSTEIEDGKRIYEVELIMNGHNKDISMDAQGHIVEIEEETPLASLPPAVKDGLIKAAGKGAITKVESLTKNGKIVAYEAKVKTGTKSSEIQVGPDGKKLAHPE